MSEFEQGILVGIVLVYVTNWILKRLLVWLVLRVAAEKIKELKESENEILLKLEKHGDVIYCYRKDNNEFVGQGSTLEEIAESFKQKYPSRDARILKEDSSGLMP